MPRLLISSAVGLLILLSGHTAHAIVHQYVEDFTTTQYRDSAKTTVDWDTVAGEIKLFPFQPIALDTVSGAFAAEVAIAGDLAFVGRGTAGLDIVDITDPANMSVVSTFATPGNASVVAVTGDAGFNHWAMRIGSGDPEWEPLKSGFTSSGPNATQVASYDGHVMVGDRITYMFDGTASLGISLLDETVTAVDDVPFEDGYRLDQNVPNPFNPLTSISYTLAHPGHVQIDLFNVAGQHIVTLVDSHRSAGRHAVTLDMKDAGVVTSGVYFYRLITPGFIQTRKMLLLK